MTDQETSDATDIAWLRGLAESGAQGPFRGAATLMAAGLIYGLASLAHWLVMARIVAAPPVALSWIWLGATAVFLAISTLVNWRLRAQGGVTTAANRAARAAWSAVGLGIFALIASIAVVTWKTGGETGALWLLPSVVMVFYGLGWGVSGAMSRSRPLYGLAAASLIAAPVMAIFTGSSVQYLAYAACLFGLMALPGFVLMRQSGRG